jgi:taurine dioxygenase
MTITARPFAAGLGADISGVDLREPLSVADRDAIRAAWLANLVLRFRGQPMTDEQHMRSLVNSANSNSIPRP